MSSIFTHFKAILILRYLGIEEFGIFAITRDRHNSKGKKDIWVISNDSKDTIEHLELGFDVVKSVDQLRSIGVDSIEVGQKPCDL